VLIAVSIVIVETFNNRFGYTNLKSIIWYDKKNWSEALRFRGTVITQNVMTQLRHYGNVFQNPGNLELYIRVYTTHKFIIPVRETITNRSNYSTDCFVERFQGENYENNTRCA